MSNLIRSPLNLLHTHLQRTEEYTAVRTMLALSKLSLAIVHLVVVGPTGMLSVVTFS